MPAFPTASTPKTDPMKDLTPLLNLLAFHMKHRREA